MITFFCIKIYLNLQMPSSSIIQTPQQQQPSSVQSIQSPVMMNSYQQQHSSGGGSSNIGIPHSPMPPSNQHYQPIQSPMPVKI